MKRIICWTATAYILGIIVSNILLIDNSIFIAIVLLIAFIFKYIIGGCTKVYFIVLYLVSCFLLGIIIFQVSNDISLKPVASYTDKPIYFTGTIADIPVTKEDRVECIIKITEVVHEQIKYSINAKAKLFIYIKNGVLKEEIEYKDIINVRGELKIPSLEMNEGGFNYNLYLKSQGIYVTSSVNYNQVKKLEAVKTNTTILDLAVFIRRLIVKTIDRSLPQEEAGLLKAMTAGDRNDFTKDMQEIFKKSGLSHIVAVSGMHLTILLGGMVLLLNFLRLKKILVNIICIFLVILYVLITGATPSVVRAGIVAIIFLLAYLVSREADALTSLFFAGLLMLLFNPMTLFNAGFQLSFCSTLALLLFCKPIYDKFMSMQKIKVPKILAGLLSASITAQIGTLPLVAYHFNGISLISLLSNLVVVPMTSSILMGGIILVIVAGVSEFLAIPISGFLYAMLKMMLISSKYFANLPFAYVNIKSPDIIFIIIYLLMVYMLYNLIKEEKDKAKIKTTAIVIMVVLILAGAFQIFNAGLLKVTLINVGQGDSILIKAPSGRTVLIDGGGAEGDDTYDVGSNVLVPFLIKRGVVYIDIAVVTHYHADHVKGVISVLENIKVGVLILPYQDYKDELFLKLLESAKRRNIDVYFVTSGDNIYLGEDISMDVLAPDDLLRKGNNPNNKSMVLILSYGSSSFIFTGDIESETERYIMQYTKALDVDVIKVAHHGSNTSSTEDFIKAVSPDYAAISVGKNNFGHPSKEVINRLNKNCSGVFRTDINGTINFYASKQGIKKVIVLREGE